MSASYIQAIRSGTGVRAAWCFGTGRHGCSAMDRRFIAYTHFATVHDMVQHV